MGQSLFLGILNEAQASATAFTASADVYNTFLPAEQGSDEHLRNNMSRHEYSISTSIYLRIHRSEA